MIKIIVLGKLKEDYLTQMVNDYLKRTSKYHKISLIELKDEEDLGVEAKSIFKHIDNKDFVVTLEIEGKSYDSIELAKFIDNTFINYSTLTFIIA